MRPLLILPVLALCLAACGTHSTSDDPQPTKPVTRSQTPAQPAVAEIGETAALTGDHGTPIKAILTGVMYADSHTKDYRGDDRYAVAVAFTLVAMGASDKLPAPIFGHAFQWYSGDEQRAETDATTPWEGCINAYNPRQQLIADHPTKVILDMLLPAKGGVLTWNDEAGPIEWKLPAKDSGHGTEPAAKFITDYC